MTVKKDTRTPQAKSAGLLVAMTGKASPAKAVEGDKPVFAYIESLPGPQKSIAKHVDALVAKALPDLKRAVKWGMAYYGVPNGWCFTPGAFVGHLKLMLHHPESARRSVRRDRNGVGKPNGRERQTREATKQRRKPPPNLRYCRRLYPPHSHSSIFSYRNALNFQHNFF